MNKINKIIVLQGVPASGKSTFAREYIKNHKNTIIVNRDNIRLQIRGGVYDATNYEDLVSEIEISNVRYSLSAGYDVIIDATNLNPKTINKWNNLSKEMGVDIEYKEFYISFKEAIERDKKRGEYGGISVGKKVIERFYVKYYKDRFEEELKDKRLIGEYDNNLKDCIICDLDGTIALCNGRTPFDWNRIPEDKIDDRMVRLLSYLNKQNCLIIFLTGRDESAGINTKKWLTKNFSEQKWVLAMKEIENKYEKGHLFKERYYEEHIKGHFNVIAVFEDEPNCVNMWRSKGLLTCQVWSEDTNPLIESK